MEELTDCSSLNYRRRRKERRGRYFDFYERVGLRRTSLRKLRGSCNTRCPEVGGGKKLGGGGALGNDDKAGNEKRNEENETLEREINRYVVMVELLEQNRH